MKSFIKIKRLLAITLASTMLASTISPSVLAASDDSTVLNSSAEESQAPDNVQNDTYVSASDAEAAQSDSDATDVPEDNARENSDIQSDTDTESNADTQTDIDTESDVDTQTGADTQPDTDNPDTPIAPDKQAASADMSDGSAVGDTFWAEYDFEYICNYYYDFPTNSVEPERESCRGNFKYEITKDDADGHEVKVIQFDDLAPVKRDRIAIPSTVEHNGITYTVTSIGSNAFRDYNVGAFGVYSPFDVILPDTIVSIESYAFYNSSCGGILFRSDFPDKVPYIPNLGSGYDYDPDYYNYKFSSTKQLQYIGDYAFAFDKTKIGFSSDHWDYCLPDTVTYIGKGAFQGCQFGPIFSSNSQLEYIGDYAFYDAGYVDSDFKIPSGVTYIGNSAFERCYNLQNVSIPSSLTYLGDHAFAGCKNLNDNIILPASLLKIGGFAFEACEKVNNIMLLEDSVTVTVGGGGFGRYAFANSNIENVYCTSAVRDTIMSNNGLGRSVFINYILLPTQPEAVDLSVDADIQNGTATLSWQPNGEVTSYQIYSASICDYEWKLVDEQVYDSNKDSYSYTDDISKYSHICYYKVVSCSKLPENAPDSFKQADPSVYYTDSNTANVVIEDELFCVDDFYYQITDTIGHEVTVAGVADMNLTTAEIPKTIDYNNATYTVTSIRVYSFKDCVKLESIHIPDTVTSIGDCSFTNCVSLTSVNIPDSVTWIGTNAFKNCTSLITVHMPSSITSIGESTFAYCKSLLSIDIPDSVTSIGTRAFEYCDSLESVIIPASVSSMGAMAFSGCSKLKDIMLLEDGITIGGKGFSFNAFAFYGSSIKNVYCTSVVRETIKRDGLGKTGLNYILLPTQPEAVELSDTIDNGNINLSWTSRGEVTGYRVERTTPDINDSSKADENNWTPLGTVSYESGKDSYSYTDETANAESKYFYKVIVCNETEFPENAPESFKEQENKYTDSNTVEVVIGFSDGTFNYQIVKDNDQGHEVVLTGPADQNITTANIPELAYCNDTAYTVTSIGENAFKDCDSLTTVDIPDSVSSIGKEAFWVCRELNTVNLPQAGDLESIGKGAFGYCESLTTVDIPDSVRSIEYQAFWCCSALNTVTFSKTSNLESIGPDAFYYCGALESIDIPDSVNSIEDSAFYSCTALNTVNLPQTGTLKSIGDYAFKFCTNLNSIIIPASVVSIGNYAFDNCNNLKDIMLLEDSITVGDGGFGKYAFTNSNIENVYCTSAVRDTIMNNNGLGKEGLNYILLPTQPAAVELSAKAEDNSTVNLSWDSKGDVASYRVERTTPDKNDSSKADENNWTLLGTVSYESGKDSYSYTDETTNAESKYFYKVVACNELPENTPESFKEQENKYTDSNTVEVFVTKFSDGTFNYQIVKDNDQGHEVVLTGPADQNITTANIPELAYCNDTAYTVASIGKEAFKFCNDLTTVDISDGVSSIEDDAFWACERLTTVNIPDSVNSIGTEAFRACFSLTTVDIPDSVSSIGAGAFYACSSLESIDIPDSVSSIEDHVFDSCKALNTVNLPPNLKSIGAGAFCYCSSLESIDIPDSVSSIGASAFSRCEALKSIDIPGSVSSIGAGAFLRCYDLESINIPNSVSSIGDYVFGYCRSLKSIDIPDSVDSIGDHAFYFCDALNTVNLPQTGNLKSIGDYAFGFCENINSMIIPASVVSIGNCAFNACTNLKDITLLEDSITVGDGGFDSSAFKSSHITNVYCTSAVRDTIMNNNGLGKEGLNYILLPTQPYNITVDGDLIHGTITTNYNKTFKGMEVTLTVTPDIGYKLKANSLTVKDSIGNLILANKINNSTYAFEMPASDVTVSAEVEANTYTITTAEVARGSIDVASSAKTNDEVTVTVVPDDGYQLDTLMIKDEQGNDIQWESTGNNAYTFRMPASNVNISATLKQIVLPAGSGNTVNSTDLSNANIQNNSNGSDASIANADTVKTGDTSTLGMFAAIAALTGSAILFFKKRK